MKEMIKNRQNIKIELMKEAERVIDELLDWGEEKEKPSLTEIEGEVLRLRKKLSEKMGLSIIQGQETVKPVPGPSCKNCKKEMSYKGIKDKTISSWVGEMKLERGHYYCDQCQIGFFPPR